MRRAGEAVQAGHVDQVACASGEVEGNAGEARRCRIAARCGEFDLREPRVELAERWTLRQRLGHVVPDVGVAAGKPDQR